MLALAAAALFSACSRGGSSAAPAVGPEAPIVVAAFQVQPQTVQRTVELVGTLEGQQEVTVSSELSARVVAVRADLGDRVERGQVLVELDARELQLAVERQKAALSQVLAQLGVSAEGGVIPPAEQTSIVRKAAADLNEAKIVFDRTETLVSKGVSSKALYDTAQARLGVAEANYASALEQVRNLQAQLSNLRAQLALAEKKVGDAIIRASFAGTVRSRMVEVGQYLREQTPVMSIASTNPLKLRASVPERWFPFVREGAQVTLTVEAYPDRFAGRVVRVARAVDPQSRTFTIEAHVDNAQERLRPGLFARALLNTGKTDPVLQVPVQAVVSFYGVQKIYTIEGDKIAERVVKLGDRSGDTIEVTDGLKPGDLIATTELTRIRQGTRVRVKKEA
jgi:multidrug efflux pump subunit AcrA (membrane-fusion protein)